MSGKYMRKCTKCGVKHSPPTGAKCTMVFSEEDDAMPSLEDGDSVNDMWNWAGYGGPSKLDTGYHALDSKPYKFSPNKGQDGSEWPCVSGRDQVKSEVPPKNLSRDMANIVKFEPNISKAELKSVREDVTHVKRDLDRVSAESRTSLAKLSKIEDLLRQSLPHQAPPPVQQRPIILGPNLHDVPNKRQGKMSDPRRDVDFLPDYIYDRDGRRRDQSIPTCTSRDGIDRAARGDRSSRDYIPPHVSSIYESSSSSSGHSPTRGRSLQAKPRDKRKTYKIERFLPRDERVKPMNTDKLWYCHGSLMLVD